MTDILEVRIAEIHLFPYFQGFRFAFSSTFTRFALISVTMPFRLYQKPSFVCHTSSASILTPLVSRMNTGPILSSPLVPVDTGFKLIASRVACG